jgi:hypothetical protein
MNERLTILDRKRMLMKTWQEEQEIHRQQQRAFDREQRRQQRFIHYLEDERKHMEQEDLRSYQYRAYYQELQREAYERESMSCAEAEQCEYDHFWGLDYYQEQLQREEQRLRQLYAMKVKKKNAELVKLGCIQKFDRKLDLITIGNLKEDLLFEKNGNNNRQIEIIKKLKAEEYRGKLKVRRKTQFI